MGPPVLRGGPAPEPGLACGPTVLGPAPGPQTHPLPHSAHGRAAGFPYAGRAGRHRVEKPLTSAVPCVCSIWGFFCSFFLKPFFLSLNRHFKPPSKPCIKARGRTRLAWLAAAGLHDCHPPLTRTNGVCSHATPELLPLPLPYLFNPHSH